MSTLSTSVSGGASEKSTRRGRRPIHIDAARLEELARTRPTQLAVATELNVSQSTLATRLLDTPELRRAWERGRAALGEAKAARVTARTPAPAKAAKAAEPVKSPPSAPAFVEGTARARVLEALAGGGLTFGGLMHATRLNHYAVVVEVQRLKTAGRVRSTQIGTELRHFLVAKTQEVQVNG